MNSVLKFLAAVFVCTGMLATGCGAQDRPSEEAARARPANDHKVILFVIDGPRHTEAFDDSSHAYIPRMWNDLRPKGALIANFRNDGQTLTNPGHASMLTGTWQTIANDGSERPTEPTLFEYYRKAYAAPSEETYIVSGKNKLKACSFSTSPGYGEAFGADYRVDPESDREVFAELTSILQNDRPRLVMACFPTVDRLGHMGRWAGYLSAMSTVDSLVHATWLFLQSNPFYAGQTYLIVSADHGRHGDDHGGFNHHGCGCEGCRRVPFLALGPDIRPGYTTNDVYDQRDICSTVAEILDIEAVRSQGRVIEEIFESGR